LPAPVNPYWVRTLGHQSGIARSLHGSLLPRVAVLLAQLKRNEGSNEGHAVHVCSSEPQRAREPKGHDERGRSRRSPQFSADVRSALVGLIHVAHS
jgi:hypothetical protein